MSRTASPLPKSQSFIPSTTRTASQASHASKEILNTDHEGARRLKTPDERHFVWFSGEIPYHLETLGKKPNVSRPQVLLLLEGGGRDMRG